MKTMNDNLVSVIIPTKDRCALLRETLQSVMEQTYDPWEAIVIDDGSSDETAELMSTLADQDTRIRFLPRAGERQGAPVCRNQGVAAALGQFIVFLDSDDLLAPTCLEHRVAAMQEHPELDFAVFRTEIITNQPGDRGHYWNRDTGEDDLDRLLKLDVPWQTTAPIWRRTGIEQMGPWDEALLRSQDWEFHLRALIAGLSYQRFPVRDSYWRAPGANRSTIGAAQSSQKLLESRRLLLVKVYEMLREARLLNVRRKRLLAMQFFHFAQAPDIKSGRIGAQRTWHDCRRLGLVNQVVFLEGWLYFQLRWDRPRQWMRRFYLERRWPRSMFRPATTLQQTPGELVETRSAQTPAAASISDER